MMIKCFAVKASAVTPRRGFPPGRAVLALTTAFAALCAMAAEYDVTRYGARPDGETDSTAAIQKAIDDCAAKGGGRVLVPGGGTYVTYTLNLKNNVDLHIDRGATLLGGYSSLLIQ